MTRAAACNDIREHRVLKDGHYYLVARISRAGRGRPEGIRDDDLIRLWNLRGSVVCAAQVTDRLRPGTVISAYDRLGLGMSPMGEPGKSTDLGGCVNMLNSSKDSITKKSHGIKPNTTLIQVEKWTGVDTWKPAGGTSDG